VFTANHLFGSECGSDHVCIVTVL